MGKPILSVDDTVRSLKRYDRTGRFSSLLFQEETTEDNTFEKQYHIHYKPHQGTDEVIGKYTEVYCGNLLCYGIDHIDRTKIKGSGGKEESASEPPSLGYLNFVPAV